MHYSQRTEIRALRQPWVRDTIALYVCKIDTRNGQAIEAIAEPLAFHALIAADEMVEPAPTLRLTPGEAQQLIDQLWRTGIRPTEGAGSVGQLQATERHLEDMCTLVFTPNSKVSEPGPVPSTSPSFPKTSEPRPGSL